MPDFMKFSDLAFQMYHKIADSMDVLYTRRDVRALIRKAQRASMAEKLEIRRKLEIMLNAMEQAVPADLSFGQLVEFASRPEVLALFPEEEELEEKMFLTMVHLYKGYPSPPDYLRRIVDRLEPENWKDQPLRVRILRAFILRGDGLKVTNPVNKKPAYIYTYIYNGYPAIRSYVSKKAGRKGLTCRQVAELVEDDVFSLMDTAAEAQLTPKGTYGLLRMVDDLAKGHFLTGKGTKKALYLFAMVYSMTYQPASGQPENQQISGCKSRSMPAANRQLNSFETDLETNLFFDFYSNNLMRFLLDDFRRHPGNYERLPSGQGINYKNFAEAVYLYVLSRPDLEPQDKLRYSYAMITNLKEKEKSRPACEKPQREALEGEQAAQMSILFHQQIDRKLAMAMHLDDEDFLDFVFKNYDCSTTFFSPNNKQFSRGELDLHLNQERAWSAYQSLIEDLNRDAEDPGDWVIGLQIGDYLEPGSIKLEELCRKYPDQEKQIRELADLLTIAHQYLTEDAFAVKSPEEMSRTALLSAAYHHYINYESDSSGSVWEASDSSHTASFGRKCAFPDFEKRFVSYMDSYLEKCGYQSLNTKSPLDCAVIFSAYLTE